MTPAAPCAPPSPSRPLRAAEPQPQRDHLVDDEQRTGAPRRAGYARKKVRGRRDNSARAQDGFEEHGGDLIAMAREHGFERRRVAVFGEQRATTLARPFGLEVVVRSVIALARHQQPSARRYPARELRGQHPGLAARVAQAYAFDRGDALADKFRELDLRLVARRPRGARCARARDRLDDRRIGVAVDEAGVVAEQIDVAVAVDVP